MHFHTTHPLLRFINRALNSVTHSAVNQHRNNATAQPGVHRLSLWLLGLFVISFIVTCMLVSCCSSNIASDESWSQRYHLNTTTWISLLTEVSHQSHILGFISLPPTYSSKSSSVFFDSKDVCYSSPKPWLYRAPSDYLFRFTTDTRTPKQGLPKKTALWKRKILSFSTTLDGFPWESIQSCPAQSPCRGSHWPSSRRCRR